MKVVLYLILWTVHFSKKWQEHIIGGQVGYLGVGWSENFCRKVWEGKKSPEVQYHSQMLLSKTTITLSLTVVCMSCAFMYMYDSERENSSNVDGNPSSDIEKLEYGILQDYNITAMSVSNNQFFHEVSTSLWCLISPYIKNLYFSHLEVQLLTDSVN